MIIFRDIANAWRLLIRDLRAGELHLIAAALVIAVGSMSAVGFFTDRVNRALVQEANQLLGADLVVASDKPVDAVFGNGATVRGLKTARASRFPSMVIRGADTALSDVKVVSEGYPLRGGLRIADAIGEPERTAAGVPAPGTAWVDERLWGQLALNAGDEVKLGNGAFRIAAVLVYDPDLAIGFLNAAPRIIINEADVAATGLIQPGSRIRYRLLVAGQSDAIDAYRSWATPQLQGGQRLEGVTDARPEIRSALARAGKFLNLAGLLTVVLAAVAIALSVRRYLQRHLDGAAVMRCMGAPSRRLIFIYFMHFLTFGLIAAAVGCGIGLIVQALLAWSLAGLLAVTLPSPGWQPVVSSMGAGIILLLAFALPPLVALARVPALRVIRREIGAPGGSGIAAQVLGVAAIFGMIVWQAQDLRLGVVVAGGYAVAAVVSAVFIWLLIRALSTIRGTGVTWRFGVANLQRRPMSAIVQIAALGAGIMALLILTLIRGDLVKAWQGSLPPDAPNRFLVNVQPGQIQALSKFFADRGVRTPELHPMVRARLTAINGKVVNPDDYAEDRARRLAEREFNLSWTARMQRDNQLVSGRWWGDGGTGLREYSIETGIGESLGMKLGDTVTFEVAGTPVEGRVASTRKVDWDSFNVNFFVLAAPGMLDGQPASYVTSFHLPDGNTGLTNDLVREFPNILMIDVGQVMSRVQTMMDQVARAIQVVFLFTLAAGFAVLYAAVISTQDERLYQGALMRTLGASRSQLMRANLAEFALMGALAGVLAAAGASLLGHVVATRVLNLDYSWSPLAWVAGILCGAAGVALAGYIGTRRVAQVAPLRILRG